MRLRDPRPRGQYVVQPQTAREAAHAGDSETRGRIHLLRGAATARDRSEPLGAEASARVPSSHPRSRGTISAPDGRLGRSRTQPRRRRALRPAAYSPTDVSPNYYSTMVREGARSADLSGNVEQALVLYREFPDLFKAADPEFADLVYGVRTRVAELETRLAGS